MRQVGSHRSLQVPEHPEGGIIALKFAINVVFAFSRGLIAP